MYLPESNLHVQKRLTTPNSSFDIRKSDRYLFHQIISCFIIFIRPSVHPSLLLGRSRWQHGMQVNSDIPLYSQMLSSSSWGSWGILRPEEIYITPPASPGSTQRSPPSLMCPGNLQRSRGHPHQMPKSPQLSPHEVEGSTLSSLWMSMRLTPSQRLSPAIFQGKLTLATCIRDLILLPKAHARR